MFRLKVLEKQHVCLQVYKNPGIKIQLILAEFQLGVNSNVIGKLDIKLFLYSDWVCTAVMSNDVLKDLRDLL